MTLICAITASDGSRILAADKSVARGDMIIAARDKLFRAGGSAPCAITGFSSAISFLTSKTAGTAALTGSDSARQTVFEAMRQVDEDEGYTEALLIEEGIWLIGKAPHTKHPYMHKIDKPYIAIGLAGEWAMGCLSALSAAARIYSPDAIKDTMLPMLFKDAHKLYPTISAEFTCLQSK